MKELLERRDLDMDIREGIARGIKAEAEIEKLINGIMNVYDELGFEMGQDGYTSVDALSMVEEIAESNEYFDKMLRKAEAEIADIRKAVKQFLDDTKLPRYQAEEKLRDALGGEDE